MKQFEKRLRALELAAGQAGDNSFCAQVARVHARGKRIPCITVEPGETVEEVRDREGIADDMPCIAHMIVESRIGRLALRQLSGGIPTKFVSPCPLRIEGMRQ